MSDTTDLGRSLLPLVREVAREAGEIAMRYFRSGLTTSAKVWSKAGGSPVTEADISVDTFLKVRLSHALPEAGWLSEETADDHRRLGRRLVWIVDPIDGTRAFLAGNHDWSIAIALLSEDRPILGIVHVPAHDQLYEAAAGAGATRNGGTIGTSPAAALADATVSGPVPFIERLERRTGRLKRLPRVPSLALRIARVAEGSIDVGLVSGHARDWDIAAADLVLAEAGGRLSRSDGTVPTYNGREPVHGELVASSRLLHRPLIDAITPA